MLCPLFTDSSNHFGQNRENAAWHAESFSYFLYLLRLLSFCDNKAQGQGLRLSVTIVPVTWDDHQWRRPQVSLTYVVNVITMNVVIRFSVSITDSLITRSNVKNKGTAWPLTLVSFTRFHQMVKTLILCDLRFWVLTINGIRKESFKI